MMILSVVLVSLSSTANAFLTSSTYTNHFHLSYPPTINPPPPSFSQPVELKALPNDIPSLWLAESTESWRQYVPLVVSLGVITDILLGSPLANKALHVARTDQDDDEQPQQFTPLELLQRAAAGESGGVAKDPNERVDTAALAQAALDKASATTDLRQFLEDSKSDWQKMKDVQSALDKNLAAFDSRSQEAASKIRQEQSKLDDGQ